MEQNFKIAVPEGCTVNIEKNDNFVIVSLEPNNWEPKDGDIYVTNNNGIGIYNANREHPERIIPCYLGLRNDGILEIWEEGDIWGFGYAKEIRPATEEEKRRLFDALAKEGKRWNAEEKRIEDLPRWRALYGDNYYSIGSMLTVDPQTEIGFSTDDKHYYAGNYFKTREAAEKVACQIREIFKNSKAE